MWTETPNGQPLAPGGGDDREIEDLVAEYIVSRRQACMKFAGRRLS
jgi:hypothetical protein